MRGWFVAALLVTACKSNAPAPVPSASGSAVAVESDASTMGDAEVATSENDAGDAGNQEDGAATAATGRDDGAPLPPLAKGAAWSLVRWDMARADVIAAFEKAGVTVLGKTDAKTVSPETPPSARFAPPIGPLATPRSSLSRAARVADVARTGPRTAAARRLSPRAALFTFRSPRFALGDPWLPMPYRNRTARLL